MDWKEIHWKELLDPARRGIVIPVVGPDLLTVEVAGENVAFAMVLAAKLAEQLSPEERKSAQLSKQPTLHELALVPRWKGRETAFAADLAAVQEAALKEVLPRVLDPARPTPLRQLAEISDFSLYLTTTPDTLLERVLAEVRGLTGEEVRTFFLRREPARARGRVSERSDDLLDLPRNWEAPKPPGSGPPTLFYLFGRIGSEAHFDVTEEQRLEMLWRLLSEDYRPKQLMGEVQDGHILLLGTRLPDWVGRYFIRLIRGQRLVETGGGTEALADLFVVAPEQPAPPLITFLQTFSQSTRIYWTGPTEFIQEYHRLWLERSNGKTKPAVQNSFPRIAAPPRDLKGDGCFISYRRVDALAAAALYQALVDTGLPVWLDLAEMRGGERIEDKIRQNVEAAAFFLPLLSANTTKQSGYFRKEWAWALECNNDFTGMSGRGYLRPIIVDVTTQAEFGGYLPKQFTDVHIDVFLGGVPTPDFLAQIVEAHRRWATP